MAKYDAFIFKKKKKDVSGILVDASSMIPSRNKFGTVGIFENQEDYIIILCNIRCNWTPGPSTAGWFFEDSWIEITRELPGTFEENLKES